MVLGNDFIWAHLGKTGGNSTKKMFDIIKNIMIESDPIEMPEKHYSFQHIHETRFNINGKKRILNIRRLPSYIISFIMHKKVHDNLDFSKEEINNGIVRQTGIHRDSNNKIVANKKIITVHVDDILRYYEPEKVDYWMRTEKLAHDFIRTMHNFRDITKKEQKKIYQTHENGNSKNVFSRYNFWTKRELEQLYQNCPLWAKYEKKTYGDLLI